MKKHSKNFVEKKLSNGGSVSFEKSNQQEKIILDFFLAETKVKGIEQIQQQQQDNSGERRSW